MDTIFKGNPLQRARDAMTGEADEAAGAAPAMTVARALPVPLAPIAGGVGNALTLVAKIKPKHRDDLAKVLAGYGGDITGCQEIVFGQLRTVHFLRWVIIDTVSDGGAGTLVLESNHDGSFAAHVDDLLRAGARGLHAIYRHCVGYPVGGAALTPADFPAFKRYLEQQQTTYGAFHVGAHGKSAEQIRVEAEVRAAIESFLDRRRFAADWPPAPARLYDEIRAHVIERGLFARFHDEGGFAPRVRLVPFIVGLLAYAVRQLPLLPLLPWAVFALRHKERTDVPARYDTDPDGVHALAAQEDVLTQNQLTHYVPIKPGRLRRWLLRTVLRFIDLTARFRQNQGQLGGISTIHFARWVIVDEGRQLLFFSNYDGSWENYLGDFIDKAALGLTGIWSNSEGFPATHWLAWGGATDEGRFKAWTRAHQVKTPLWYSAYPDLTVRNVLENQAICRGLLQRPADADALGRWLQFF